MKLMEKAILNFFYCVYLSYINLAINFGGNYFIYFYIDFVITTSIVIIKVANIIAIAAAN